MQTYTNSNNHKWLCAGSHASIFISISIVSIAIPILIYLSSEDIIVKKNAKEAINFHFNVWLYGGIITFLSFLTFGLLGWILGPIWVFYHWSLSIWAIIYCLRHTSQEFHYPFIFRIF